MNAVAKSVIPNAILKSACILTSKIPDASKARETGKTLGLGGYLTAAAVSATGIGLIVGASGLLLYGALSLSDNGKFRHFAFRFELLSDSETYYLDAHLTDAGIEIFLEEDIDDMVITPHGDVKCMEFDCSQSPKFIYDCLVKQDNQYNVASNNCHDYVRNVLHKITSTSSAKKYYD